ncbi:hypothetical protein [Parvicella tangerina]|uniref:Uncharacterized protein n=1 Tax=Parvicella tangerina TaxID=2829795 RepID=A0A916JQD3_9FLAO|nr:hypothetical protein [Parvicella tangerina]CAG5086802.1 hypothetical protein CRYO30217_03286 [Parvicella tangerina]
MIRRISCYCVFALLLGIPISLVGQDNTYNPYERFGEKDEVLTLSNGKFDEFFDLDSIEIIGSAVLNTNTMQVIGFIEIDTMYSEATLEPEIVSRWLSPDPYYKLLPSESPYNFAINSPIRFLDPDGNIVSAGNDESWAYIYNTVMKTFSSNQALQDLFTQTAGTLSFEKIDEEEFQKVIEQVDDPKLKALAYGYYEMINASEEYTFMAYHDDSYIADEPGFEGLGLSEDDMDQLDKLGGMYDDNINGSGFVKPSGDEDFVLFMNMDFHNEMEENATPRSTYEPSKLLNTGTVPYSLSSDINGYMLSLFIMENDDMKAGGYGGVPQERGGSDSWDGANQSTLLHAQIYNLTQSVLNSQPVNFNLVTRGAKIPSGAMTGTPSELSAPPKKSQGSSGSGGNILPPFK